MLLVTNNVYHNDKVLNSRGPVDVNNINYVKAKKLKKKKDFLPLNLPTEKNFNRSHRIRMFHDGVKYQQKAHRRSQAAHCPCVEIFIIIPSSLILEMSCIHQDIGCDLKIGSGAEEDICGVCKGNGTTCRTVEGRFNQLAGSGTVTTGQILTFLLEISVFSTLNFIPYSLEL